MPLQRDIVVAPAFFQVLAFAVMKRRKRRGPLTIFYHPEDGQMSRVFGRHWQEDFGQEYVSDVLAHNILAGSAFHARPFEVEDLAEAILAVQRRSLNR
jgi:hypothetical protein